MAVQDYDRETLSMDGRMNVEETWYRIYATCPPADISAATATSSSSASHSPSTPSSAKSAPIDLAQRTGQRSARERRDRVQPPIGRRPGCTVSPCLYPSPSPPPPPPPPPYASFGWPAASSPAPMDKTPTHSPARPPPNGAAHSHGHAHSHHVNSIPDHNHNHAYTSANTNTNTEAHADNKLERPVAVSLLQPRVAVLLGLPKRWHRLLSLCRLLCLVPCFWWGLRLALRFLVAQALRRLYPAETDEETPLMLTETFLAGLWCVASATLAFYFTDCLMSRWLINYTPQATVVRLLAINFSFTYLTSWIVYLTGGTNDPRLLLPAWILIATILTACYHFTQRKVPIRKETRTSISVFSFTSFISIVALLIDINTSRPFPETDVPLITIVKTATHLAGKLVVKILGVNRNGIEG
ncbi:N-glycosylation protein-domain-containing protein [Astrocystis sublimbata]|nr:N-glycosylation protein-domain-containing protein [Astrocystis sublimbata]